MHPARAVEFDRWAGGGQDRGPPVKCRRAEDLAAIHQVGDRQLGDCWGLPGIGTRGQRNTNLTPPLCAAHTDSHALPTIPLVFAPAPALGTASGIVVELVLGTGRSSRREGVCSLCSMCRECQHCEQASQKYAPYRTRLQRQACHATRRSGHLGERGVQNLDPVLLSCRISGSSCSFLDPYF